MKVLVTAFKPFNNMPNNYSMEVLEYITDVDKVILDVCYDYSYQELISKFDLSLYDLVIAMGEARMRSVLTLETQAKNISSCSLTDNINQLKKDEVIILDGDDILYTKVSLEKVEDIVKLSNDAGKFVCNNLYYHLLYNYPNKSIFIHVPNCNNDMEKYREIAKEITEIIKRLM
jgi:pyrrolidone-carboxylate peptidase